MSPSTTVRRAGVVTASALALSLGGAITAGSASALTVCPVGKILTKTGTCVAKTVDSVVPKPTAPSSGGGSTSGGTSGGSSGGGITIPKLPLPTGSGGSTGGSSGGSTGGSSGGSSGGGLNIPLPSLPGTGGSSGGGTGGVTDGVTTPSGPTLPSSNSTDLPTTTKDGSSVPGATPSGAPAPGVGTGNSGMLGPASAYLPSGGILGFTNFGGTGPITTTSASALSAVPSPLLAGQLASQQASQLASVQAPLLAAGEEAAGGGTVLAAFGNYALPGLLVVLATAVVGTVGAGNIRVWQARLAARRA